MKKIHLTKEEIKINNNWHIKEIAITYFSYLDKFIKYWISWKWDYILHLDQEDIVYIHSRKVSKNKKTNKSINYIKNILWV